MQIKLGSAQQTYTKSKKLNLGHTDYHQINQIVIQWVLGIHEDTEPLEIVDMVNGIMKKHANITYPGNVISQGKFPDSLQS